MSDAPPPWNPFDNDPQPGLPLPPEAPAAPAPQFSDLPPGDEPPPAPPARKFPIVPAAVIGGAVVLIAVIALVIGLTGGSSKKPVAAPLAPVSSSSKAAAPGSSQPASKKPTPKKTTKAPTTMPPADEQGLSHSAPTAVKIPKIGVSSSLVSLGLQADGTLQVPSDFAVAGWYAQGAYPGDADQPPALIVGHVDDYKGPAVFFRLKELTAGDRVIVPRADGSTATFVVYKTANFLKTAFPAQSVYAATKRPELRLITCTGQFDSGARSYLSNFVAYAYLEDGNN